MPSSHRRVNEKPDPSAVLPLSGRSPRRRMSASDRRISAAGPTSWMSLVFNGCSLRQAFGYSLRQAFRSDPAHRRRPAGLRERREHGLIWATAASRCGIAFRLFTHARDRRKAAWAGARASFSLAFVGPREIFDVFKNVVLTVRARRNYIRTTGGDVA